MGNCQTIDSACSVIQHPGGKVDRIFCPISANQVMKMNPGHYVALLLTTTLYSSPAGAYTAAAAATNSPSGLKNDKNTPLRVTRIKLLRPTDTLALGHVYRLVTSQDVMKGLVAKKQAKMSGDIVTEKMSSEFEALLGKNHEPEKKKKQAKHERHRSRNNNTAIINSTAMSKSRAWQPSLRSISEAGS